MSFFHTPRKPQTRGALRRELANQNKGETFETKSENMDNTECVKSGAPSADVKSANQSTSSSTVRRMQLELQAAQEKARIQLEAAEAEAKLKVAQTKARLETELLEKRLEVEMAELESRRSEKSLVSSVNKVQSWLFNSKQENIKLTQADLQEGHQQLGDIGGVAGSLRDDHCALQNNIHEHPRRQNSDINNLADAIREAISASSPKHENKELLTRLATSKDLPVYFGEPMEWLQFKEAYNESTKLCKYSDTENMWRLRKCLRGDAKDAVSSLLIGDTNPDLIIATLELRFGRPENIMYKIMSQLKKLQPLPSAYHNDIVTFAIKIKNYVAATVALKQNNYLHSPEMINTIVCKLPTTLISKWADHSHDKDNKPKLELLSDFLHEEAIKTAKSGVSHIYSQSDRKKTEERKNQYVFLQSDVQRDENCKFCKKKQTHNLENCSAFKRAMRRDRWRFVRTNNLCYKCLRARHSESSVCTADECDVEGCGQPHHRLLHWTPRKEQAVLCTAATARPVSAPPSDADDGDNEADQGASDATGADVTVAHTSVTVSPKVYLKVVPVTLFGPSGSVHTHALLDDGATVTLIASDICELVGLYGKSSKMRARSAWDSGELVCQTEIINCHVSNRDGDRFTLEARKMNELNLPIQPIPSGTFTNRYDSYKFCYCNAQPKILIGQDNYHLITPLTCIGGKSGEPFITKTPLGWCLHGVIKTVIKNKSADRFITHLSCCEVSAAYGGSAFSAPSAEPETTSHLFTIQCSETPTCPLPASTAFPAGIYDKQYNNSKTDKYRCECDYLLHEEVRRSFAIDSIGISSKPRQNPDELRALSILDNTSKFIDGQWTVGLPWKFDNFVMPDSYQNAINRLKSVERKMLYNSEYAERYRERVQHLLINNYARQLKTDEYSAVTWYLPHFGVDNPNKKKLRLVFDAASKSQGLSLNDFLLQGPDLLQSIYGIMLRFREKPIGIIGDIKDMFLRIKIREEDQHAFRFLWKESGELNWYVMNSLIFGANCSPFIAQHVNQNLNVSRFQDQMPEAVAAIRGSQYMDDYIDSLDDEELTRNRIEQITFIHKEGGFEMRNWMSNNTSVLRNMPEETLSDNAVRFKIECQPERTLGLLWYPSDDMLAFDLSLKRIPCDILQCKRKPTKRELLKIIMSIYDILGFLGPFTIKAKIIMRNTWQSEVQWDQEIIDDLFESFKQWMKQLQNIESIRIPRWYFKSYAQGLNSNERIGKCNEPNGVASGASVRDTTTLQLHIFCDASPTAYAAVAYWRKQCSDGNTCISFVASKSRIAPTKPVTIPRLELQGALLACRLANTILKEHRIQPNDIFYWTDSTTVLHWIKNQHKKYKTFIANRLSEIDELSKICQWNYVPTNINVADLATKDSDFILQNDCEWFSGPSFLYFNKQSWPHASETKEKINDEHLEIIHNINITEIAAQYLPVPDPVRFSSWLRLLRCTATVLLFVEKLKKNSIISINDDLMEKAEMLLLRHSQSQTFQQEIILLKQNKDIERSSRLLTLTPYIDNNNLLRVGGRIGAARDVSMDVKSPIILDGCHHTARLIVKHYHVMAAHSCNETIVNELRQKYWLLKLRPTVRTVASKCMVCRIRKTNPRPPRLGDLPEARLTHHQRPFTICGVDLFGPMEVTIGRQRQKRYGVLFTCLTVRAVHIELVSSLTADSMIMVLRRMASRRGWPRTIISDNGTNFHGADTELKKSFAELDQQKIIGNALNTGVNWKFIPPGSPHMGGAWERLIRSVKNALKVVLRERAPKEEVLATLLAEIENIINSRPLTHVSVDPRSPETLTPNHFLIGSSSNLPTSGVFDDSDLYLRRQWRIAQRLADLFWSRWMKEILPTLIPRRKWNREGAVLKVGDFVVLVDPSSPRNVWPKGIIQTVYPGPDGRVRVVDIKTKTGVMKRPATRVAPIPLDDECQLSDTRGEDVDDGNLK